MRRVVCLLLTLLLPAIVGTGVAAAAPAPAVTAIPANAGRGWPVSGAQGVLDLAGRGYVEQEYLLSGQAETYAQDGRWTDDGRWATHVATTGNPYTTRMVVVRPRDPARFTGTVVVEWLNVSFGVDIPVDFSQSYEHFLREGYTYVGVTTQKAGADKLKSLDPVRYGTVDLSSDALSYDVFSQAAQAVRTHPELLGGRTPAVVLGTGHSQSALRLTTYANAVQPVRKSYDGLMIHGRATLAAPIGDGVVGPLSARIRTDLDAPVFVLQSETDVVASASVRQDTARVRTWEVAGTAHADQYGLDLYNAANARDRSINDGAPTTCDKPVNSMTFRYAENAAFAHLDRWARGGAAPPAAPPISLLLGLFIRRDADQNALGGIRLPDLDAPVAAYAPDNSGGNVAGACLLLGTTTPLSAARIRQLHPDHAAYVAKFTAAADRALGAGYLLPADHDEAVARAQAAPVP
ncbi:alpha/beta hydrolase domain-containing protein [Amycolatopsis mongoliensis]|uniref:Alpha/beta hydrolase domain-containing protein n=1 Tax=Amycolatopsis mongoliensis TaxID=715475 RepID=A0A9Y2JNA1_9PSEU|nr:alpha/beta hydrolase domain-containing protein [Amycolatopsis sp. 4-36]WIY00576.1 alpha/beta hydrolase domain-containing protein [Amycolatopsis sp. 4-36]